MSTSIKDAATTQDQSLVYERVRSSGLFLPKVGEHVRITKTAIKSGEFTKVENGQVMEGKLLVDLSLDKQLIFENGNRTSLIKGITVNLNTKDIGIETETSYYDMEWNKEGGFEVPQLPKAGDTLMIRKVSLDQGAESRINEGESFEGKLSSDVKGGIQIHLSKDALYFKTSPIECVVFRLGENGEKQVGFKTRTSLYVIEKWEKSEFRKDLEFLYPVLKS